MSSAKLIYLAAPYSHAEPAIIAGRMAAFSDVAATIMRAKSGFPVSPLLCHDIVGAHGLPGDWEFWQHYSRRLLGRCDELHVIPLPGWEASTGVQGEIEFAESLSLPTRRLSWSSLVYRGGVAKFLADEAGVSPSLAMQVLQGQQEGDLTDISTAELAATREKLRLLRWGAP